jgi:hypothetical protein
MAGEEDLLAAMRARVSAFESALLVLARAHARIISEDIHPEHMKNISKNALYEAVAVLSEWKR